MSDGKIGEIMELSRYAVQRRRRKALDELRNKLAALMPKGG
jgi:DNA-directed RNA polymerase specialized sigma subunit